MKYATIRDNQTELAAPKKDSFPSWEIATLNVYYTMRILTPLVHPLPDRFITCRAIFVVFCRN